MEIIRYSCTLCNKKWIYDIEKCPLCDTKTEKIIGKTLKVIGFTKVFLPSTNNLDIPYNVVLLQDEHGNKLPVKTTKDYKMGEIFQ